MKTAREVFESQTKFDKRTGKNSDPEVAEFYHCLRLHGAAGQLAEFLLLSQRSHDRLKKVHDSEYPDPDYERLMRGRNNFNIARLIEFCLTHQNNLNISMKHFNYGIRIRLRREATIRFRHIEDFWTGDDANLQPICAYCDRLVNDERTADRLRKVHPWPAAV